MNIPLDKSVILLNFVSALQDAGFKMEHCFWCLLHESGRPGKNKLYAVTSETFGITPEKAEQWWSRYIPSNDSGNPMASAVLNFLAMKHLAIQPRALWHLKALVSIVRETEEPLSN